MRKRLVPLSPIVILCFFAGFIQPAFGAPYTWTGNDVNLLLWSNGANWDPIGPPGELDDARFFDLGATNDAVTVNNRVASSTAIQALWYGQTNGFHNTGIDSGVTLTVSNTLTVGTESTNTIDQVVVATISGAGRLRTANTNANIVARQLHPDTGPHRATLDLSALDTFEATSGRLLVGVGSGGARRAMGTILLARTNLITLFGGNPQILVGDNSGNNNANSSVSFLTLGQKNTIYVNTIRVGGQKQQGNFSFNANFLAPTLLLRGNDGVSRATELDFGDNSAQGNSGNPTTGTINWGDGQVDVQADLVYIGRGQTSSGGGGTTGTLTIGSGVFDANTMELGFSNATNAAGAINGTINVNSNGFFTTGATLKVNSILRIARASGSTNVVNGTININGGSVFANTIVPGGGNSTISITGGILAVTNTAGTLDAGLANFNPSDAVLRLAAGGAPSMVATNVTTGGAGNVIHVDSIAPVSSYPATNTLIRYSGSLQGSAYNFTLGSLPPTYVATLVDNSVNSSVDLVISSGPPPVAPRPTIGSIAIANGNVVLTGSGGSAGRTYYVRASGDVATPLVNWPGIATNTFDSSGNFNVSVPYNPGLPIQFFVIQVP
jgi:hypothetical protein